MIDKLSHSMTMNYYLVRLFHLIWEYNKGSPIIAENKLSITLFIFFSRCRRVKLEQHTNLTRAYLFPQSFSLLAKTDAKIHEFMSIESFRFYLK